MHNVVLELFLQLRYRILAHQFKLKRPYRTLCGNRIHNIKAIFFFCDYQIQPLPQIQLYFYYILLPVFDLLS